MFKVNEYSPVSLPSHASVTLEEASAPDKLPTMHDPAHMCAVRHRRKHRESGISRDATYPTHSMEVVYAKL